MKKHTIVLIILVSFISIGCSNGTVQKRNNPLDTQTVRNDNMSEETTTTLITDEEFKNNPAIETDSGGPALLHLAVGYDKIEDMVNDSECIIMGTVIDLEYVVTGVGDVSTKTTFKIEKCYKGDYKKGDLVTYCKYGGITTLDNYWEEVKHHLDPKGNMTKEKAKEHTVASYTQSIDSMLQINDKLLIFGKHEKENFNEDIPKGSIFSIGMYQTEFHISKYGNIKRFDRDSLVGEMKQSLAEFEEKLNEGLE